MAQLVVHISEDFQSQIQRRLQEVGLPQQRYVAGLIARELFECGQINQEDAVRFSTLSNEVECITVKLPMELYGAMKARLPPAQTIQGYLLGLMEADLPRIQEGVPLDVCREDLHPTGEVKRAKVYYPAQFSETLRAYWNGRGQNRSGHIITLIRQDLAFHQDLAENDTPAQDMGMTLG